MRPLLLRVQRSNPPGVARPSERSRGIVVGGESKIGLRFCAAQGPGGIIVRAGGILGSVECAEPHSSFLPWISDLRCESPPGPLSYAPEMGFFEGPGFVLVTSDPHSRSPHGLHSHIQSLKVNSLRYMRHRASPSL